jgi:hypothetical protein
VSLDEHDKPIRGDITEQHRTEMMQIASLIQLSFLRRDERACPKMPDRLVKKLRKNADEFLSAQKCQQQCR